MITLCVLLTLQQQQHQAVAGFSVGEITALLFAKAISFDDGRSLPEGI